MKRSLGLQRAQTLILPNGEAVQRSFTLEPSPEESETSALLANGTDRHQVKPQLERVWRLVKSQYNDANKAVLKCAITYLLGAMATFVPLINKTMGRNDGKHVVATVIVYFHPSRTAGSMLEATLFAIGALLYSLLLSVSSMATAVAFEHLDMIAVGHAFVLIIFCGGGLGMIAYAKAKMGKPTFGTACSLACLSYITILVKEGNVQLGAFETTKILQTAQIVLYGVVVSNMMCLSLWPKYANENLKARMVEATDNFSDLLTIITRSFLYGVDLHSSKEFLVASGSQRSAFTSLKKHLEEAKFENFLKGREKEYQLQEDVVESLQRLAQHIGGLRSAAAIQCGLLSDKSTQEENTAEYLRTLFETFIGHLGPPMKSFAFTMKTILDQLPFGPAPKFAIEIDPLFRTCLLRAMELYKNARLKALKALYSQKFERSSLPALADQEEVAASCGHFSYSLEEFAAELMVFIDIIQRYEVYKDSAQPRTWGWTRDWIKRLKPTISAGRYGRIGSVADASRDTIPQLSNSKIENVPNSLRYRIWKGLRVFRQPDNKFAIKVGIGAAIFALPAFIPSTRPFFRHWRGEWGLLSYMIIQNMNTGATSYQGFFRILGTMIGCALSITCWELSDGNAFALAPMIFFISLPCFWLIVNTPHATFGRFILLTLNLSVLYAYNLTDPDNPGDDDDEGEIDPVISAITLHRFCSVLAGVLWGIFINSYVWPLSARFKLRYGLSVLWLRMGLIWKQDPLNVILDMPNGKHMSIKEEHSLQKSLLYLGELVKQAPMEIRLKGDFPVEAHEKLLASTQAMLDAFHSMNIVITKEKPNENERMILKETHYERNALASRIFLYYYCKCGRNSSLLTVSVILVLSHFFCIARANTEYHRRKRPLALQTGKHKQLDEQSRRSE